MANFDSNVVVNLLSSSASAQIKGFGSLVVFTDDVTFATATIKKYTSNSSVQADAELGTTAKTIGAAYFAQTPNGGDFRVAKIAGAAFATADYDAAAADALGDFYVVTLDSRLAADLLAISDYVEADSVNRLCFLQTADADVLATGTPVLIGGASDLSTNTKTALYYHSDATERLEVATPAVKMAADPDVVTTTFNYAQVTGVTGDEDNITDSQLGYLEGYHINSYLSAGGQLCSGPGVLVTGDPIDTMVSKHWYEARVREACIRLFVTASALNRKIPFDNVGIGRVASTLLTVQSLGLRVGHFEDSIENAIPDISVVSSADRLARRINISSTATLKGAIENATFNLSVLAA
jgi:hypothetical protein